MTGLVIICVFVLALLAFVAFVTREPRPPDPLDELRGQLARGEVTEEQFWERESALRATERKR